jgi:hypothetical protein
MATNDGEINIMMLYRRLSEDTDLQETVHIDELVEGCGIKLHFNTPFTKTVLIYDDTLGQEEVVQELIYGLFLTVSSSLYEETEWSSTCINEHGKIHSVDFIQSVTFDTADKLIAEVKRITRLSTNQRSMDID